MRALRPVAGALAAGSLLFACDSLFGIQAFPDGPGDAGGGDALTDAAGTPVDAQPDTARSVVEGGAEAGPACTDAGSCPTASPVCSQGRCTAITALVPGTSNTQCVILADATLWCWGWNISGQLGRGAIGGQFYAPAPVTVLPPGSSVQQAGAGNDYACALTSNDHAVRCWGTGVAGSGVGTAVQVQLPADGVELSVGSVSACARVASNDVYCWGDDTNSNIGCGPGDAGATPVPALAPRLVIDASKQVVHIAGGLFASCGVPEGNSRAVYCVGNGQWGTLGGGDAGGPCASATITNFASNNLHGIVGSDFATCTQDDDGTVYCWGMNDVWYGAGLLDPNSTAQQFDTPFAIPLPPGAATVSIGWLHGCALDVSGDVYCWGASTHGETGIYSSSPVPYRKITGLGAVSQMVAQRQFTCALQRDGQVLCWGNNQADTVGPSVGIDTPTPTKVVW